MAAGESPATLPPTPAEKAAQAVAQTAVAAKNSQKPENQPVVSDNFTKAMKENDFSYSLAGTYKPDALLPCGFDRAHSLPLLSQVNGSPLSTLRTARSFSVVAFSLAGLGTRSSALG